MILAFDTYYRGKKAKTVCIGFDHWTDTEPKIVYHDTMEVENDYEPGAFYKRELPCILRLLKKIKVKEIELILIDGFVVLDDQGKYGLGGYLYERLDKHIPVAGVAKTDFRRNRSNKKEVFRGKSKKPLFVTALGIDVELVSEKIKNMHGEYRIPALLKHLDRLTKEY